MIINSKAESIDKIQKLCLNRFPEQSFHKGELDRVQNFIDTHSVDFYAIRCIDIVGYKTQNKLPRESVFEEIEKHNTFSVGISSFNYVDSLLLIGDVRFGKDNSVWLMASTKDYPYKAANAIPEYNCSTDIFNKKLNAVPGFDIIYGYVVDKGLLDVIVEFAVYSKPLGIYYEPVVIFEIRTGY